MIRAKAELTRRSLNKFRKQFGDTTNQALLRLAVSVGRECALLTQPYGASKKKIQGAIKHGAEANVAAIPATLFNKIAKSRNPAFKFKRGWVHLNDGQILKSGAQIWDFIEDNRMENGRVRWLPHRQKAIASFAQKHIDKGTGKFRPKILSTSEARLISDAPATKDKRIFAKDAAKKAVARAWRKTLSWYRRQCRLKFAK